MPSSADPRSRSSGALIRNRPATTRRLLTLVLAAAVSSCGGGGAPSTGDPLPTPNPSLAPILSVSVVDGAGAPVTDAAVTVDGIARAPRMAGSHVYDVERALVGRALGVDREGFLFHQALVPAQDLVADLFPIPDGGGKTWIRAMLYDAAFSPGGTLVRLLRPVSIVRGASVPDADWARVRSVWEQAAGRMSDVTGTAFRVVEQPEPGTVVYSVEIAPDQATLGMFHWSGPRNVIERGTASFRSNLGLGRLSLVLHELTHGFGLNHSDRATDVMHPEAVSAFHSEREEQLILSLRRRPAQTAFEDDVRNAARSSSGESSGSHSCGAR